MLFKNKYFYIFLLLSWNRLSAQNITGIVVNAPNNMPIEKALIKAQAFRDTSVKYTAFSDSTGHFHLVCVRGFYKVSISKDGYIGFTGFAKLFRGDTNFGLVLLTDTAHEMKTANISVKAPPAVQKGDTSEYSASAYKTNPDATAEDLIKKMPGVTVQNGTVTAHGETVKKVTVDGKEWFGDDASAVLRNLPSEVVDKMQIFDRMSDQSTFSRVDDGTGSKSINIVTKKGMNKGKFGKIYAGYGTDDKYQAGFNYNSFNGERRFSVLAMDNNINQQNFSSQDMLGLSQSSGGSGGRSGMGGQGYMGGGGGQNMFSTQQAAGISKTKSIGFNYTDKWGKKTQIATSYFLTTSENDKSSVIFRDYINNFNPENSQVYNENSNNTSITLNHRFNLRLTYSFDTSNILLYTPRITYQQSDLSQTFAAGYTNKTAPLNNSNTIFSNEGSGININNNVLYMHKFKKPGRNFSINIGEEYSTKKAGSYNDNTNRIYFPVDSVYIVKQNINLNGPGSKYNTRLTYNEPIGKHSSLQPEYAYNYTENKSNKSTNNFDTTSGKYKNFDNNLSNIYKSVITTSQYGLSYSYRDDKWNFSAGGTYQVYDFNGEQQAPFSSKVNFHQGTFLPRMMLNYKVSKNANWRFYSRTSTNAPSISQLQKVIDVSNPLLLTTGNQDLHQEISRFGVLRYSRVNVEKGRNFFMGFLGNLTENYIANNTTFFKKDTQISEGFTALRGSQLTKPINLQGYYNARVFGNYGFPIKKIKSNANFNGAYSYTSTPGMINGIKNIAGTQNYNAGVVLSSNISPEFDYLLSYSGNYYSTKNTSQVNLNNSYYNHTASIKLNWILMKKIVLSTDWNYNNYSGLSSGYNQTFKLWNAAIGYKFLKNNAADIRISCFDILKQNRSIARTITETYVEDNRTKVLTRYFMITFTYNLRRYNMPQAQSQPALPPGVYPGAMPPGH